MANIEEISGVDAPSGSGAFDPLAGTETTLRKAGRHWHVYVWGVPGSVGLANSTYSAGYIKGPALNVSSDTRRSVYARKQPGDFSNRNWTKFECSETIFLG